MPTINSVVAIGRRMNGRRDSWFLSRSLSAPGALRSPIFAAAGGTGLPRGRLHRRTRVGRIRVRVLRAGAREGRRHLAAVLELVGAVDDDHIAVYKASAQADVAACGLGDCDVLNPSHAVLYGVDIGALGS